MDGAWADSWGKELQQATRQAQLSHLLNNRAKPESAPSSAVLSRITATNAPAHAEGASATPPRVRPTSVDVGLFDDVSFANFTPAADFRDGWSPGVLGLVLRAKRQSNVADSCRETVTRHRAKIVRSKS